MRRLLKMGVSAPSLQAAAFGSVGGEDLCLDNDTPALNALKALRGAPIGMGRGEIPVGR